MSDKATIITDAILGTLFPIFAFILSYQEEIEQLLRIVSLLVGITVGIVSIIHLRLKITNAKHEKDKNNS